MESKKEEAANLKSIAEKKLEEIDYDGARKYALKAQCLYPGLEGIPQMVTMINVLVSAEKRVNDEIDWYKILSVNSSVDDENIRKQYRKLVLLVHPDKNKYVGADSAFKLVHEACEFLSDKSKRFDYDQKTKVSRGFQAPPSPAPAPAPAPAPVPVPDCRDKSHNFTRRQNSAPTKKRSARTRMPRDYHHEPKWKRNDPPNANKFHNMKKRTVRCPGCNFYFMFEKGSMLNGTLVCSWCKEAFAPGKNVAGQPDCFSSSNSRKPHNASSVGNDAQQIREALSRAYSEIRDIKVSLSDVYDAINRAFLKIKATKAPSFDYHHIRDVLESAFVEIQVTKSTQENRKNKKKNKMKPAR